LIRRDIKDIKDIQARKIPEKTRKRGLKDFPGGIGPRAEKEVSGPSSEGKGKGSGRDSGREDVTKTKGKQELWKI
jgi:hypothetical protein